jgi:hypothetical protein
MGESLQTSDFKKPGAITPMKFSLRDMPHATIETNRTCNMRCAYCYNLDHKSVKPLSGLRREIDLLLEKRNLQAITVLGGEPTLHPDLVEVVEYIKSQKVLCQLLTNGLVFLNDNGKQLLEKLIARGLDRIVLHVDYGQCHVHADVEKTRHALFAMMERKKIHFSLSITIDSEQSGSIPERVKTYASYRYFDGVLAVLARDPFDPQPDAVQLEGEYASIADRLGIEPSAYIPSNLSDRDVRWIIYYYFINAQTGRAFAISPNVNLAMKKLHRFVTGRHLFILQLPQALAGYGILFTALFDLAVGARQPGMFLQCVRDSGFLRSIRLHYIAIQVPPEFDKSSNAYIMCHHCPDATVRNGKIMPVCIADKMSPLAGSGITESLEPEKYGAVHAHLDL